MEKGDLIFQLNRYFRFRFYFKGPDNTKSRKIDIYFNQIKPIEPAVNPTTKKNANSVKSLGIELTIRLI